MGVHDPKERAREKAGWGLPVPAPAGARTGNHVVDELFAAPKAAGADADPVASLFQDNRVLPAPSIADVQSEAEITRWRATGRASLFDERVADPAPGSARSSVPAAASSALGGMSAPPPVPAVARKATPSKAAPPAVPVSLSIGGDVPALRGGTSLAPLSAAAPASAAPVADEAPARRRRIERGPKKRVLAAIGVAATLALGSAAAVLRLIPSPVAPASESVARPLRAAIAEPARPMAVPVHAFKPAPVPVAAPVEAAAAAAAVPAAAEAAPGNAPAAAVLGQPAVAVPDQPVAADADRRAEVAPAAAKAAPAPAPVVAKAAPAPAAEPAPAAKAEVAEDAEPAATSAGSDENQRAIAAANKKLAEDDATGAEALMREVLARDPSDHHAMEALVRALIDQDRGADAVPFARKMVKRRTKRVPYRLLLGDALLMTGDENGARREWKAALDLEPNDRQVRMRLGL